MVTLRNGDFIYYYLRLRSNTHLQSPGSVLSFHVTLHTVVICVNVLLSLTVEYRKKQDPCLLQTGRYENTGKSMIALSPDGRTVAIATGTSISVFSTLTGACEQTFRDVHNSECRSFTDGKLLIRLIRICIRSVRIVIHFIARF